MRFFVENETEKNAKKPTDYRYIQLLRTYLLTLNTWPAKEIGEKVKKYRSVIIPINILLKSFYFIAGWFYMKNNVRHLSFYEMGHTYIMLLMTTVALTRIFMVSLSKKCTDVAVTFLTKMHLFYFKDLSEHAMKTHKRIHLISHIFSLCLIGQFWVGTGLFNLIPIYRNYASGKYKERNLVNTTFEHAIYLQYPFDTKKNFNGYMFAFTMNCWDSYVCAAYCLIPDLLLSLIVFHLWGHYKILLHELRFFPMPGSNRDFVIEYNINEKSVAPMYSEIELKVIAAKLKKCIDYHRLIADFTKKISAAFGPMLLIYYGFHQASGCLLLLECSQMTAEALICYGPFTVISFQQLIQLSVIFELVGSASEKLKDAVYGVPWEYMDYKNRKVVAIFLLNVQKPIHVKALGLARIGVTTMAAIIRTSLTYFTFLRSM